MTQCVCGNTESLPEGFTMRLLICRCNKPGPGKRAGGRATEVPDRVPRAQVEERRRVGLPVMTDIEKSAFTSRWI